MSWGIHYRYYRHTDAPKIQKQKGRCRARKPRSGGDDQVAHGVAESRVLSEISRSLMLFSFCINDRYSLSKRSVNKVHQQRTKHEVYIRGCLEVKPLAVSHRALMRILVRKPQGINAYIRIRRSTVPDRISKPAPGSRTRQQRSTEVIHCGYTAPKEGIFLG